MGDRATGPLQQAGGQRVGELGAELGHDRGERGGEPRGSRPWWRRRQHATVRVRQPRRRVGGRDETQHRPLGVQRHAVRAHLTAGAGTRLPGRRGVDGPLQGDDPEEGALLQGRHLLEHQPGATGADVTVPTGARPTQAHQFRQQFPSQHLDRVAHLHLQGG